jgi:hypothetical protein
MTTERPRTEGSSQGSRLVPFALRKGRLCQCSHPRLIGCNLLESGDPIGAIWKTIGGPDELSQISERLVSAEYS